MVPELLYRPFTRPRNPADEHLHTIRKASFSLRSGRPLAGRPCFAPESGCGTPLDRLEPLRHFAERSLFRLEGFRFEGGYFLCFEGPGLWKFPNFNFGHLSAVSGTCELNDVRKPPNTQTYASIPAARISLLTSFRTWGPLYFHLLMRRNPT